jgi:hypothetical protein
MSQTNTMTVGFGVPASGSAACYFICIPARDSEDETVLFAEDVSDVECIHHARILKHTWSTIAFALRGEFNKRLRTNGFAGSKWSNGYNVIESTLGAEALCLLCAIEQQPTHVRAILEGWMLLLPHERLWLSAQARSSSAWRAGIAVALAGDGSAEDCWRTAA